MDTNQMRRAVYRDSLKFALSLIKNNMPAVIRVWDLPTRAFHWSLVVCVAGLVISGNLGGGAMAWHFRFGYCVATLLMFRVVWGLVGGHWSRFASFAYPPGQVLNYLRSGGNAIHKVGHNPLGALSVFAMLGILVLQVASGLMSDDEISASGPLVRWVSGNWVSLATWYHKDIGKVILIFLVVTHLGAITFYRWRKNEHLVRPMLTGDKLLEASVTGSSDTSKDRIKAVVVLSLCAGLVWFALSRWG
jgi:cytochrome b